MTDIQGSTLMVTNGDVSWPLGEKVLKCQRRKLPLPDDIRRGRNDRKTAGRLFYGCPPMACNRLWLGMIDCRVFKNVRPLFNPVWFVGERG